MPWLTLTVACSQQPKIKQHPQRDLDTVRGMKWGQEADVDTIIEWKMTEEKERRCPGTGGQGDWSLSRCRCDLRSLLPHPGPTRTHIRLSRDAKDTAEMEVRSNRALGEGEGESGMRSYMEAHMWAGVMGGGKHRSPGPAKSDTGWRGRAHG